jgi:hypothetical protein
MVPSSPKRSKAMIFAWKAIVTTRYQVLKECGEAMR